MILNLITHAKQLLYSNANSKLLATDVQTAIDLLKGYLTDYVIVVNTTVRITVEAGKSATINYTPVIPEGYKIIASYMYQRNNPYIIDYFVSSNNIYLRNIGQVTVTDNPIILQNICIRNI